MKIMTLPIDRIERRKKSTLVRQFLESLPDLGQMVKLLETLVYFAVRQFATLVPKGFEKDEPNAGIDTARFLMTVVRYLPVPTHGLMHSSN